MAKDSYHIRPVWRREVDIDALARLVLALALQLAQEAEATDRAPEDEEAA